MAGVSLTGRGRAAAVVVGVATLAGFLHGGRSLFAVVVSLAAVLLLTRVTTARIQKPSVTRRAPGYATVGDTCTVDVSAGGPTWPVRVEDRLPDGLDGEGVVSVAADEGHYTVTVAQRGVHRIGPLYATVGDPLGFWTRRFRFGGSTSLVAVPSVDRVDVDALVGGSSGRTDDRAEFDSVREYQRGDPLRNVNWKASAKHTDGLVVTTYAGHDASESVTVVADASSGDPDVVATAAASVAIGFLDAGYAVGLHTATETVEPSAATEQRRRLLTALARLRPARPPDHRRDPGTVVVRGKTTGGAEVQVGDTTRPYGALAGESRAWENAFQP